ncbi:hypothetical protein [Pseudomonas nitroreducens]|uniref:hypothetical protein n=1 Tax=Pseudomonas nitroreducens TaxID=46680 RepID=UPI0018764A22|nr:hypothetical protein [Pseudomonas nitritireducens]
MQNGHAVVWAAVCMTALSEDHGVVRPFSIKERAEWACRVLAAHYAGRVYQVVNQLTDRPVDSQQMEIFEGWAMEEVAKLELADKYKAWSE